MLELSSEINIINPAYAKKLRFYIREINVRAQKIDKFHLNTFEIVLVSFSLQNYLKKVLFF